MLDGLQVDALEPELLRKRISFDEFLKVHQVERKLHTLQVALDFFAQVGGTQLAGGGGGGGAASCEPAAGGLHLMPVPMPVGKLEMRTARNGGAHMGTLLAYTARAS